MADVGADGLAALRLQRQKKQIELNVFDGHLRLAELKVEAARTEENLARSQEAIADLDAQIADLTQGETNG